MFLLLIADATTPFQGGVSVLTHITAGRNYRIDKVDMGARCEYKCYSEKEAEKVDLEGVCGEKDMGGVKARVCVCEGEEQCNRVACSKDGGLARLGADRRKAGATSVILALYGIVMLG